MIILTLFLWALFNFSLNHFNSESTDPLVAESGFIFRPFDHLLPSYWKRGKLEN